MPAGDSKLKAKVENRANASVAAKPKSLNRMTRLNRHAAEPSA